MNFLMRVYNILTIIGDKTFIAAKIIL